jgi:hypothetical protein
MYVRDGDEAGNSYTFGLGTRLTPGYLSGQWGLTAQFAFDVPIIDNHPEETEPLKPQLGLGFTAGFSPLNTNRWSVTGAGAYLLNRWENRDVEPDDEDDGENGGGFPIDLRAGVSVHF